MAIYTRAGDKGKTTLFSGQRVLKSDLRIEVYGSIDELNSMIGAVLSIKYQVLSIKKELVKIQNDLLEIGSILANPRPKYSIQNTKYFLKRIKESENLIDKMTAQMPKLSNFILPGGGKTGAMLHLARAVCRRVERRIVQLNSKHPSAGSGHGKIDSNIIIYFNRLSDLLFTMARFANFKEKRKEIIWSNRK